MTSDRSREILLSELEKIGLTYTVAELEKSDICELSAAEKYFILCTVLQRSHVSQTVVDRYELIDRIKLEIKQSLRSEVVQVPRFSVHLSKKLPYSYAYLSRQFSLGNEGTLENYIIEQKIVRAKELLLTERYTLSDIAWLLDYSSVSHLSNQFKRVTGFTPTHFKRRQADGCLIYTLLRTGHERNLKRCKALLLHMIPRK